MSYSRRQFLRDLDRSNPHRPVLSVSDSHWGRITWTFLYTFILSFEEEDTSQLTMLIENTGKCLPCKECREHFLVYSDSNPLPKKIPEIFFWLNVLENEIASIQGGTSVNRLLDIRKTSSISIPKKEKKPLEKRKKRKSGRDCINCNRPRIELGANSRNLGITGISSGRAFRPANKIG